MLRLNMVKNLDRIRIGVVDAVVCAVYDDERAEVVYKDWKGMDINEDVKLVNGKWEFEHKGPAGGYAKGKERLREAVAKLNMSPELRHHLEQADRKTNEKHKAL